MPKAKSRHSVFLVDDHPLLLSGLHEMIDRQPDFHVVGTAGNYSAALSGIRKYNPEMAVIDISLDEGSNGLELIKAVRAEQPELKILVFSMHDETLYAERAVRAGARGYIMKEKPPETILAALRVIQAGHIFLSDQMQTRLVEKGLKTSSGEQNELDRLTDRELEVFQHISTGEKVRDIAEQLGISAKTVEYHRENIKHKLGLASAADLIRYAAAWMDRQ